MVGGVSDHTLLMVRALVDAGDVVDVWMPPAHGTPEAIPGASVHVLPSLFGMDALRILRRALRAQAAGTRVLVQYVPTGFGWRMMNLPFAALLFMQRKRGLDVYFHEVGFVIARRARWRRNVAGVVHLAMNWLTVRAASRVFVAIPEWQRRLELLGMRATPKYVVDWVPVPSNVPDTADAGRVTEIRNTLRSRGGTAVVGHFGTFGRYHVAVLSPAFTKILDDAPGRIGLFVGRNSVAMRNVVLHSRPDLAPRIVATGGLEAAEVSAYLSACDVLVQPYEDGASSRRGSLMAGIALGRAVVTNRGPVTGSVWGTEVVVELTDSADADALANAVGALLADPARREALGASAREVYRRLFALEHGVNRIRSAVSRLVRRATRVLMLHTTLPRVGHKPGGVEVAVHRLANTLVELGVPVTVASLTDAPTDARYRHRRLFRSFPSLRDSRVLRLFVLPALLNFVRHRDADIVHYHGDDWFVLRRTRPTIRTLHGSALREAQRAVRWQRRLAQYLLFPLERLAARMATIAVAVGQDAASLHGIRRVIGNGVDPNLFHPGRKSEKPLLLYVGTWEGRKRGRWMYELFTTYVVPRHPDVELRFISDEAPPPHPRVEFVRFPDDAALAQSYREAWIFVLPSTYEGFGIPYLEAMASGTAVVATPNTGARELLGDGRYGMLVSDTEFGDSILALLADDVRRADFAAAGLARSRDFMWPDIARAYVEVYEEAAGRRASGGR